MGWAVPPRQFAAPCPLGAAIRETRGLLAKLLSTAGVGAQAVRGLRGLVSRGSPLAPFRRLSGARSRAAARLCAAGTGPSGWLGCLSLRSCGLSGRLGRSLSVSAAGRAPSVKGGALACRRPAAPLKRPSQPGRPYSLRFRPAGAAAKPARGAHPRRFAAPWGGGRPRYPA